MKPELVYYTASWCMPCKTFKPQAIEEAMQRGFPIIFIDVDQNPEIAASDSVMSLPTIIVLDSDGNEQGRVVGASLPTLKKTLDKLTR